MAGCEDENATRDSGFFGNFDDRAAHVVAAFGAHSVGWHRGAALRAIGDLTLLHPIVRATFASAAVAVFAFGDGHDVETKLGVTWTIFGPRRIRMARRSVNVS